MLQKVITDKKLSWERNDINIEDITVELSSKSIDVIRYFVDNKLQLSTGVKGKEIPWNDINLLKIFFRHPFYTFLIISLIHYQAVKLFFKKNKIYSKPEKSCNELTY